MPEALARAPKARTVAAMSHENDASVVRDWELIDYIDRALPADRAAQIRDRAAEDPHLLQRISMMRQTLEVTALVMADSVRFM